MINQGWRKANKVAQGQTTKTRKSCLPGEGISAESDMSVPGEDVEKGHSVKEKSGYERMWPTEETAGSLGRLD